MGDSRAVVLTGGHNIYGHAVGILMIEGRFPRPVGAIGNAATFDFPVLHHVVRGFSGSRTVHELGQMDPDGAAFRDAIAPWIEGARYLAGQGCKALSTSCGFAILFQRHLADAVDIPVFGSTLLLAPMLIAGLGRRRLGVITASAEGLIERHLQAAGIPPDRVAIIGMEGAEEFAATAWHDRQTLDLQKASRETVDIARRLVADHHDIGAILLECSLLPPYASAVQRATGLPVFDFTHLIELAHRACVRREFPASLHA
ncbi:aspartate/glutamate racemase family protein [Pseudochelatococcus sp. B33]